MEISAPVEDYLKTIFHLETSEEAVGPTVSAVAGSLGVTNPSASAMLKRLDGAALTRRSVDGVIELTDSGRSVALRTVRRHRLIETFLAEVLDMRWHEVHDEAEILEHAISDRLENRIDAYLGHPATDPHGDPIPRALDDSDSIDDHDESWPPPLSSAEAGSRFRVERVLSHDEAALRYLADLGIMPGTEFDVVRQDPFGGPQWVNVGGDDVALGGLLSVLVRGEVLT